MGPALRTLALLMLLRAPAVAEEVASPLSLEQAVAFALAHHPQLRTRRMEEETAAQRTALARTAHLPQLAVSAEITRGTGNVVQGPLAALPLLPAISGPPGTTALDGGAFGTALGAGAAYDLGGLPQRMAQVDSALLAEQLAQRHTQATGLAIAYAAVDAYLLVQLRNAVVGAARAGVERARVAVMQVGVLTAQGLRPEADHARVQAELALAQNQLIRAEDEAALARLRLSAALGIPEQDLTLVGLVLPPAPITAGLEQTAARAPGRTASAPHANHPILAEAEAAVAVAQAQRRALMLHYLPRIELLAALWARGSGLAPAGQASSRGQGLVTDVPNWVAGVLISWPVLDLVAVRARARVATAQTQELSARQQELAQELLSQTRAAHVALDSALRFAANQPVLLAAARASQQQASARYQAGLTTITEVAEAQRLLTQAESEDAAAQLLVYRQKALLQRALGDLNPLLRELRSLEGR